jgi:hypothetical protein
MSSGSVTLPQTGGGSGGIASINGDTTAAQLITGGTGISVSTSGGDTVITATGSGSGTVTSVSVTTANGVSGTVATATTTPAISLTLGAITPSSVAATGTLSGSNFSGSSSGTNTGDQTITLTGPVTGSGTGSFATSVTNNSITTAMLAQVPTLTIRGNNTGSTANVANLTVAQVNAILPVFTSGLNGLAPLSGGGTTNYLRADGTWAAPPGATSGTVTSVAVSGGTTGLTTSGGPITTSGTITLAGTLGIANGGTNATSFTSNEAVYYNGTSFTSVPNSSMSDASGYVFPDKIVFSLPGPRVVQNDCNNWYIWPFAGKITKAWIVAKTGPTGAAFICDIQYSTNNGSTFTSIWAVTPSNKIQIAASSVAGTTTSFDTSTFTAGTLFRIDIDQIGSAVAGSDVTIVLNTFTQNT